MKKKELLNVLAVHADELNFGRDRSNHFLTRYPEKAGELSSLFQLAAALKRALVPVPVRPDFVEELGGELARLERPAIEVDSRRRVKPLWVGVATAGSLLSLTGLIFILRRWRPGKESLSPVVTESLAG